MIYGIKVAIYDLNERISYYKKRLQDLAQMYFGDIKITVNVEDRQSGLGLHQYVCEVMVEVEAKRFGWTDTLDAIIDEVIDEDLPAQIDVRREYYKLESN